MHALVCVESHRKMGFVVSVSLSQCSTAAKSVYSSDAVHKKKKNPVQTSSAWIVFPPLGRKEACCHTKTKLFHM